MKLIAVSLLFCLVALLVRTVQAQTFLRPVDVPNDPRSVAMGESFTGLPANTSGLMYNPAGLAGLTGVTASYSERAFPWLSYESNYVGMDLSVATPIGVFAAQYNRLFWYTVTERNRLSPGSVEDHDVFNYDVALGFARKLTRNFSAGIAVKYFNCNNQEFEGITSTPAWLFDGGILYSFQDFRDHREFRDKIGLGLSVQNIGTEYKIYYKGNEYKGPFVSSQIPLQYLRFGVSYSFKAFQREEGGIVPLAGTITGEWRLVLSPGEYSGENFEGVGAELSFYEVLTVRAGRIWYPYSSIYSDADAPSPFRYGAGITIPLERFGLAVPFRFSAQYTAIPLWRLLPTNTEGYQPWRSFDTFSFELHYTGGL